MSTPGAAISTLALAVENGARVSPLFVAATPNTCALPAGE